MRRKQIDSGGTRGYLAVPQSKEASVLVALEEFCLEEKVCFSLWGPRLKEPF